MLYRGFVAFGAGIREAGGMADGDKPGWGTPKRRLRLAWILILTSPLHLLAGLYCGAVHDFYWLRNAPPGIGRGWFIGEVAELAAAAAGFLGGVLILLLRKSDRAIP
jgi:hypothetical protein